MSGDVHVRFCERLGVTFPGATHPAIDPMYIDRAYYLAPDGKMAGDAFAVMREGMKGKVGIGKLALYGREYLVAVRPPERGIVMYTLHHAAEIRSIVSCFRHGTGIRPPFQRSAHRCTPRGPLCCMRQRSAARLRQCIRSMPSNL
jgi:hypothetical protein